MKFHIGDLLSWVAPYYNFSPTGMQGVSSVSEYPYGVDVYLSVFTGDDLKVEEEIIRQHPFIGDITIPEFVDDDWVLGTADTWLACQVLIYGAHHELTND